MQKDHRALEGAECTCCPTRMGCRVDIALGPTGRPTLALRIGCFKGVCQKRKREDETPGEGVEEAAAQPARRPRIDADSRAWRSLTQTLVALKGREGSVAGTGMATGTALERWQQWEERPPRERRRRAARAATRTQRRVRVPDVA